MGVTARLLVAVDVGSTRARAAVFGADGQRLARAEHPFATNRPLPDHAEHASDEVWTAVCTAVREAVTGSGRPAAEFAGIAFDATCSLVLLDAAGRPVTASITGEDRWNVVVWSDHRAVAEAAEVSATGHRAVGYVGGAVSPEMQLPKLLWIKRNLPGSWERLALALDLTDFLTLRASGRAAASSCTVTCKWTYLAHEVQGWQQDLFDQVGLGDLPRRAGLPERPLPAGAVAGTLTEEAARALGLHTGCTVGVGLIDAHAGGVGLVGHLGADAFDRTVAVIAGTSTCHMALSRGPRHVPGVWGPYLDAMVPGYWLNEGGQSATGALLHHVLDTHAQGARLGADRHQVVTWRAEELLAAEGPGFAGRLLVLPDFNGNRSPLADPHLRGVAHGLSLDGSFDALVRLYYACAVGIVLGTRHVLDALDEGGYEIERLYLTGGHLDSSLLVRLYADATGRTVVLPEEEDSVLLGTAIVAATAAGLHPSLSEAAAAMIRGGREVRPDPASRAYYDRQYRRFRLMVEQRRALDALP